MVYGKVPQTMVHGSVLGQAVGIASEPPPLTVALPHGYY